LIEARSKVACHDTAAEVECFLWYFYWWNACCTLFSPTAQYSGESTARRPSTNTAAHRVRCLHSLNATRTPIMQSKQEHWPLSLKWHGAVLNHV